MKHSKRVDAHLQVLNASENLEYAGDFFYITSNLM